MERNTRQRGAIRRAFRLADRPLSPAEALEGARTEIRNLGIATVYRNIRALVEEGTLTVVPLAGEGARYELSGKAHHHHFHCRQCDRVLDVPGCPGHVDEMVPTGYTLESHDVVLYGTCGDCGPDDEPA